jgi:hypothetical protein
MLVVKLVMSANKPTMQRVKLNMQRVNVIQQTWVCIDGTAGVKFMILYRFHGSSRLRMF